MFRALTSNNDSVSSDILKSVPADSNSDHCSIIMHKGKTLQLESESSTLNSSLERNKTTTFVNIPPIKVFSKKTINFFETSGARRTPSSDAIPIAYFNSFYTIITAIKRLKRNEPKS